MYSPTQFEEFECLMLGKSCSFGICCECRIGIGKKVGGTEHDKASISNNVNGNFIDDTNGN